IEKVVVNILNQTIGYPEAADGVLTSGGTLANLTALLCARQHQSQLDPWKEGSREQFCLLVSEEAHYCVDRAVRIMGWGEEGIVKVPVDENFRMRTDLLEKYHREAVTKGKTVVAVVGSAPSTATGTYDRLEEMAAFCQAHGLWFHVDGAHGGAAIFSARYRHLLKGLEQADSIVIDCHKMMMTPSVATALLFKNGAHSHATFSQKAQYLWSKAEGREWHNLARRTFECTKLMMSLRFYALYKLHGAAAFDAFVSKLYDAGRQFARLLAAQEDFECLLPEPDANIVCFRYVPSDLAAEQWDALNAQIRQHLIEQGRFYIVETKIRGRHYLRTTIMNPMTDVQDFEELLSCVRLAAVAGPEIPQ
ncbi:MAG: pyridoxal-dependent decarboxylase, partial [Bacteroidota bacterium]